MDFLIIGGLFALALLAIIALVFVIRGESPTRERPIQPTQMINNTPSVPVPQTTESVSQLSTATSLPTSALSHSSFAPDSSMSVPEEIERFPVSNGQFHELSVELHMLHQQALEMEDRLNSLTDMVERIEHTQTPHAAFEGETLRPASDPSSIH